MGFIDYVAEYFKGPKGDPGEPGGSDVPAGPHVVNFALPEGASLVSATLDFRSSDPSFTIPEAATLTVARLDATHYSAVANLAADLPEMNPYSVANLEVLYYLP